LKIERSPLSIVPLRELRDKSAGGKAIGLKALLDLGLQVPDGFVLILPDPNEFPDALLKEHLKHLGPGPKAVRSSAVSEDGHEASFAGQFETFLNVAGFDEIKEAIRKCIEKASTSRVQAYSTNRKSDADLRISVIVQNMVDARVSGVLFTADPVTNRRDKLVLNAVQGGGESLVSGKSDGHHYTFYRSGSDIVDAAQSDGQLLSHHDLEALRNGSLRAEAFIGYPLDMEWVIDQNNQLFWVQSRPITTLNPVHYNELDTIKGSSDEVWTLGNIGEMMPGVATPLTYSTVVDGIDWGMTVLADKAGAYKLKNRDSYLYIQMFYNRLFINLTNMMEYARTAWLNKSENIQMALSVPVDPNIRETGKAPLPLRIYNFFRQTTAVIRAEAYLKRLKKLAANYTINKNLDINELYQELEAKRSGLRLSFGQHMIASGQSGTLYSAFMGILTDNKRLPDADDHHFLTLLLSDIPEIESANAVKSLESVSDMIRRHPEFAEKMLNASPADALHMVINEAPDDITAHFTAFLDRHGHRCVRESELREQPWEENLEPLIQLLQTKIKYGNLERHTIDPKSVTADILRKLPFSKRLIFRLLIPTARKAVARREIAKALSIKIVNEFRKGYRVLAQQLLDDGLVDDTDQIYFLTHQEVGELISKRNKDLLPVANRRRELLPETDKLVFPDISYGIPEPISNEPLPKPEDHQLHGTPVSSGKIKARIRIVNTLKEAELLEKGEIMVASFTDIGWSPYFSIISGLITEIGSPLSHGAVVAREYGIPAIVGVKGAKALLKNGDLVVLDGDRGIVETMEETT
jgi:rifampicin phosphotransferase